MARAGSVTSSGNAPSVVEQNGRSCQRGEQGTNQHQTCEASPIQGPYPQGIHIEKLEPCDIQ